jgi:hypothetical protein
MKKKFVLLVIILLIITLGFALPCHGNLICTGPTTDYLQYPFLWFLVFVPLSLLALTLNDQKHRFWVKFTGVFFVISMFIVYIMPEYDPGIVSLDRELTNWLFVGVYSVISLVYFVTQFVKNRKQPLV